MPWVFWGPNAGGPKRKRFPAATSPHPKPQNQQRSEENAPISQRPKRKSGRPAAGLAQPRDEHGAESARGAAESIAKRAAQLAEEGNVAAIRICMNRLSPVGQHNPVAFELPPIHSTQDWSDKEEESESDVRLRVERMIAQGKAHPDDRFFYVSWRR
jgi:hypothetical protein